MAVVILISLERRTLYKDIGNIKNFIVDVVYNLLIIKPRSGIKDLIRGKLAQITKNTRKCSEIAYKLKYTVCISILYIEEN